MATQPPTSVFCCGPYPTPIHYPYYAPGIYGVPDFDYGFPLPAGHELIIFDHPQAGVQVTTLVQDIPLPSALILLALGLAMLSILVHRVTAK
jgi:hypothetical protein